MNGRIILFTHFLKVNLFRFMYDLANWRNNGIFKRFRTNQMCIMLKNAFVRITSRLVLDSPAGLLTAKWKLSCIYRLRFLCSQLFLSAYKTYSSKTIRLKELNHDAPLQKNLQSLHLPTYLHITYTCVEIVLKQKCLYLGQE